ncbi:MAG: hypothetical protein ACE5HH_02620 [Candidatus Hydrothermarchaeales archaeon]
MFGRNLEDLIRVTEEQRSFDEDFFDFTDKLYPWTTVYRFFFLTDLIKKTQFMLGIGQKNVVNYWVNGKRTEFSNKGPSYKVGVSYWLENGRLLHETRNEVINVQEGIVSRSFSFRKEDGGYAFAIDDISTRVFLDDSAAKTDYVRFNAGVSPFYRHNKYLPFQGEIMGEEVLKGFAFIQKVNLNMPFIPWRWGRVFFENGAQLDFYEPKILVPLFKSISFEIGDKKLHFKLNQKISFENSVWSISGTASTGESIEARIHPYCNIRQSFETPRSTFVYNEMPSKVEHLSINKGGELIHSKDSLGESVANCENAYYSRISSIYTNAKCVNHK